MASQQGAPTRPWFRLATMGRPPPSATPAAPTPQPDQGPPPRPALIRPAFSQTFRAPPPAPPPQPTVTPPSAPPRPPATDAVPSPPTPPARASPPQPLVARATPAVSSPPTVPKAPTPSPRSSDPRTLPLQQSAPPAVVPPPPPTATRAATPKSSPPKAVEALEKTPPPSPNIKPISHPPSPLTLPSPQLKSYNRNQPEYEQKTVLVQETKEKPKGDNGYNGGLRRQMGWSAQNQKIDATKKPETSKKHSDSEDFGMRIITIAGENKGAIMELSPSAKKTHNFGNNPHSLNVKKDNPTASSDGEKSGTDSDGRSKAKNKNQNSKSPLMTAVMNSNVQGVNNSILYNCSTTHHDPGVHLSLSRKPNGGRGFYLKDHKDNIN